MTIEVVSIGDELLSGSSINTNAAFIGQKLLEAGFVVERQSVIGDDVDMLFQIWKEALKRSKVVIVTGGLGPTLDDITKETAAKFFKSPLKFDSQVAEDLKKRFGEGLSTLENQATVPENAIVMPNEVGTAPGFIFHEEGTILFLLPGVPKEMEPMLLKQAIPYLKKHIKQDQRPYVQSLAFYGLNEAAINPTLLSLKEKYPVAQFGIYPGFGKVSVVISCTSLNASEAKKILEDCFNTLAEKFKSHFFDFKTDKIEEAIHEQFKKKKLTLSMAESCTGGRISAKLTTLSGASDFFLGSIVCYSNFMKTKCLSISETLLKEKGAVSKECVQEMADALLKLTGSDYSLAVSGIAGPTGGTPTKPVGTVFGAIGMQGQLPKIFEFHLPGSRECVIESAANMLLFELYRLIHTD